MQRTEARRRFGRDAGLAPLVDLRLHSHTKVDTIINAKLVV
jgi:hypothetical protein